MRSAAALQTSAQGYSHPRCLRRATAGRAVCTGLQPAGLQPAVLGPSPGRAYLHSPRVAPQCPNHCAQGTLDLQRGESDAADSEAALKATLECSCARLESPRIDMFMDVAAALAGQRKDLALAVWDTWHGAVAVQCDAELEARYLLSTNDQGLMRMHDVIRNVARAALRQGGGFLANNHACIGLRQWWGAPEGSLVPQAGEVRVDPPPCPGCMAPPWPSGITPELNPNSPHLLPPGTYMALMGPATPSPRVHATSPCHDKS
jgi:hypothetical protein